MVDPAGVGLGVYMAFYGFATDGLWRSIASGHRLWLSVVVYVVHEVMDFSEHVDILELCSCADPCSA